MKKLASVVMIGLLVFGTAGVSAFEPLTVDEKKAATKAKKEAAAAKAKAQRDGKKAGRDERKEKLKAEFLAKKAKKKPPAHDE